MPKFQVCLERYVNEIAAVEVEAATAKAARDQVWNAYLARTLGMGALRRRLGVRRVMPRNYATPEKELPPMTQAEAYTNGWNACMAGIDGRYKLLAEDGYETEELRYAWHCGFLDAMEAEDDEEPEPDCAGFGE